MHDHLDTARRTVRRERRRVVDEREAFRAFVDRIDALAVERHSDQCHPAGRLLADGATSAGRKRVRQAYAETVLSVPHRDPDTTPESHLGDDLGADVAERLAGTGPLQPDIRRRVVRAATDAREHRTALAAVLDDEADTIESVREEVETILESVARLDLSTGTQPAAELRSVREDLHGFERRCDRLAGERRRSLRSDRYEDMFDDAPTVAAHLYRGTGTVHPVLATLAEVGALLARLRSDVERALDPTE